MDSARLAADALRAGWQGDTVRLAEAAKQLAGLGPGLTPAGDDLLCGVMLRARLDHPDPPSICQQVLQAASPRTTLLSQAFLQAAAAGECAEPWHRLLATLLDGDESALAASVTNILSTGHTSGADILTGFLLPPASGAAERRHPFNRPS